MNFVNTFGNTSKDIKRLPRYLYCNPNMLCGKNNTIKNDRFKKIEEWFFLYILSKFFICVRTLLRKYRFPLNAKSLINNDREIEYRIVRYKIDFTTAFALTKRKKSSIIPTLIKLKSYQNYYGLHQSVHYSDISLLHDKWYFTITKLTYQLLKHHKP